MLVHLYSVCGPLGSTTAELLIETEMFHMATKPKISTEKSLPIPALQHGIHVYKSVNNKEYSSVENTQMFVSIGSKVERIGNSYIKMIK